MIIKVVDFELVTAVGLCARFADLAVGTLEAHSDARRKKEKGSRDGASTRLKEKKEEEFVTVALPRTDGD